MFWILGGVAGCMALVVIYDLLQRRHAILRNFPFIGHFRYLFESVGPELRQYVVTDNNEERPFSRDQRRWVYASSKRENNFFGFGTDNDLELSPNYLIIKHATFPHPPAAHHDERFPVACAKILGGPRARTHAFRPSSIVNLSAMSFGSLSAAAVEALNRGAGLIDCLHNTGEGGITPHHRHGGRLIWQVGTGYFGCRDAAGRFDRARFLDVVAREPVAAVEIKLSQGAKPGHGGVLPGAKVTPEIAAIRGIPVGETCVSPAHHSAFGSADELLDFVEDLGQSSGVPIGIKSAVGDLDFWRELSRLMSSGNRGVDFITIDGGEGGTGAAPLVFSDHVALPFKIGMSRVYRIFAEAGLQDRVVFAGSGRLGFPQSALLACALGCDLVSVAREAMLAIGCIQAQRCHTGHCPTGIATQNRWLMRGLVPTLKAARFANYVVTLRKELLELSHACGVAHPALVALDRFEIVDDRFGGRSAEEVFGYQPGWGLPAAADRDAIAGLMGAPPTERNREAEAARPVAS